MQHNDILGELFDSPVKVRALKLFLRNPESAFSLPDAARRLKVNTQALAHQLGKLLNAGLLKSRTAVIIKKFRGRKRKHRITVFSTDAAFEFYQELRSLILKSLPPAWEKRLTELQRSGRVKLVLAGGTFTGDEKARVDLLIVGDKLRPARIRAFVQNLEADMGKELNYMTIPVKEFIYRYGMFDNFLRDVLERPHKKVVNRLRNLLGS